jgi:mannose-6-phosphate isomerase-like protein (cupin superfamily)
MPADPDASWLVPLARFEANPGDYVLRHGTMRVMLYHPDHPNVQTPHRQDELYFIRAGSGTFTKSGETLPFGPGDVIFVEAGAEHRFEEFGDELLVWVIFWGPDGGEK